MVYCRIIPAVALSLLVWVGEAGAQPPAAAGPGGHHRGRYIGFQPRYGQVHQPPTQPPSLQRAARPAEPVAAVNDTDPRPSSAVAPLAFENEMPVSEVFDDSSGIDAPDALWEGDASCYVADPACQSEAVVWARGDYLLWWTQGMGVPALATTSTNGTLQDDAGVLGLLNTSVLFGNGDLLDESRSGGRVILGMWLDPCHQNGLEFSYLGLDQEDATFRGNADQFSILARPFENVVAGAQDARLIAFPDLIEGNLAIDVWTEFQTGEVLLRRSGVPTCWSSVDFFLGYRYAELKDGVQISESTISLAEPTTGTTFQLDDRFETRNQFQGGQVGVRLLGYTAPLWAFELTGKMALGNTQSRTTIAGQTVVTVPTGETTTQSAGLLAQGTNSGIFETNEISTITEVGLTLRRQLSYGWSLNCGYNFLFWTDVVRAGEQIDTSINVSQIPPGTLSGEPRPAYTAATSDFWAQGLSFGLEYHY